MEAEDWGADGYTAIPSRVLDNTRLSVEAKLTCIGLCMYPGEKGTRSLAQLLELVAERTNLSQPAVGRAADELREEGLLGG